MPMESKSAFHVRHCQKEFCVRACNHDHTHIHNGLLECEQIQIYINKNASIFAAACWGYQNVSMNHHNPHVSAKALRPWPLRKAVAQLSLAKRM
eukprot:2561629-Pleurochrysis_carterae.AAC.1